MPPELGPSRCAELPPNVSFHYMNEGAANVLYRIVAPKTNPPAAGQGDKTPPYPPGDPTGLLLGNPGYSSLNEVLLRLRKDLPTTTSSEVMHQAWSRQIYPLLKGDLVPQFLVKLPENLTEKLSLELQSWEKYNYEMRGPGKPSKTRPQHRRGIYLAQDDYGIVVVDMTPRLPRQILLEFKPKWLVQSPAAPAGAKRCRTCALTARKNSTRAASGEELLQPFCPLDLTSKDPRCLSHVATQLLTPHNVPQSVINRFTSFLHTSPLLPKLKNLQWTFDRLGVFEADPTSECFLRAMTLRDCSLYVQISTDGQGTMMAKLGDLDVKCSGKAGRWRVLEEELVSEGWYLGDEPASVKQPVTCSLAEGRWEEIERLRSKTVDTAFEG